MNTIKTYNNTYNPNINNFKLHIIIGSLSILVILGMSIRLYTIKNNKQCIMIQPEPRFSIKEPDEPYLPPSYLTSSIPI